MHKIVSFKGITRSGDNLVASDGECMELINMRMRDGAMEVMAPPLEVAAFACKYKAMFYHNMANTYMCVTADSGAVHLYDEQFKPKGDGDAVLLSSATGVERIEFIGNVAALITDCTTFYILYENGEYIELGERPPMPHLEIATSSVIHCIESDKAYYPGNKRYDENSEYWCDVSKGYYDECLAKLHEKGYYVDRALFRYAFRMYDGNYLYCSPVMYVHDRSEIEGVTRDKGNFAVTLEMPAAPISGNKTKHTAKVLGFKPEFRFSDFNLGAWEKLVLSVDIFSTGSLYGHKVSAVGGEVIIENENVRSSISDGCDIYVAKENSEIWSDVAGNKLFYKVAEYSNTGLCVDYLEDVSPDKLHLSTLLQCDVDSLVGRSADYTYLFNGRLHLASLREKLFAGYEPFAYMATAMECVKVPAAIYTTISTTQGTAVARRCYDGDFCLGKKDGKYYLSPYLMYPDSRAKEMRIVVEIDGVKRMHAFPLKQHTTQNIAYFICTEGGSIGVNFTGHLQSGGTPFAFFTDDIKSYLHYTPGVYEFVYNAETLSWYHNGELAFSTVEGVKLFYCYGELTDGDRVTAELFATGEETERNARICDNEINSSWIAVDGDYDEEEQNVVEIRGNVLKVSEVDNPFLFPAKQTYTPSQSKIVAVCSNTVALSQGQFGQHPLYVFCSDGIWAMAVDGSASVAYTVCSPLSREVCTNAKSICSIDSGVVFVTRKGVLLLQGGGVTHLSSHLDGVDKGDGVVEPSVQRIANIVGIGSGLSNERIDEYLSDAMIGFNYSSREIIVKNSNYPFAYICSLNSGAWGKYMCSFYAFVNSYPDLLAISDAGGGSAVYTLDDRRKASNRILLVTRPMPWGTKMYKRIMQLLLHASVTPSPSGGSFTGIACYLLCSNDGVNFKLVSGGERRRAFADMQFGYLPTQSYRYFSVAIVGDIYNNSRIIALEIMLDTAWNNRLR